MTHEEKLSNLRDLIASHKKLLDGIPDDPWAKPMMQQELEELIAEELELSRRVTMLDFCRVARLQLEKVPAHLWAVWFVELKMQFVRLYSKGVCSTFHGADFFDNVLAGPGKWKEEGEYGNNFRKLFT